MQGTRRAELELDLVRSYEEMVHIKKRMRDRPGDPLLEECLLRELQLQQYLHALLGGKGVPPGLL